MGAALASCAAWEMCSCASMMACSCFSCLVEMSLRQAARLGHLLILLTVFTLAIILGQKYPDQVNGYYVNTYTTVNLTKDCDPAYLNECIYRQLIYRASFSLALLYLVLAILSTCIEAANRSFWIIKFGLGIGVFIAVWWWDNTFFNGWAETSRLLSFIWLLIQGLLLLDFAHDCHDLIMSKADEAEAQGRETRPWYFLYLFSSVASLTCSVVGLAYLFLDYTGCKLGMFFTILTLLLGVISTILSMLNSINKGLLTPCVMFAYSTFMCWYALLSSPDETCNPFANQNENPTKNASIIIIVVVSFAVLLYCVINGTKILNIFNPNGEGVLIDQYGTGMGMGGGGRDSKSLQSSFRGDDFGPSMGMTMPPHDRGTDNNNSAEGGNRRDDNASNNHPDASGTLHERCFFHVLMMLVSCYAAMVLTNWGRSNGAPEDTFMGSGLNTGTESLWLKIVSQWGFLILYFKVLHVAYVDNLNTTS